MNYTFSLMLLTFGFVFLFVGFVEFVFPPKSRNQKGYRIKNSLKSQEHWDYAQKYAAKMTTILAICLIGISFVASSVSISDTIGFIASIVVIVLALIIIRQKTEKAIKNRFDV